MRKVHFIIPDYQSDWRVSLAGTAPPTGPTYLYSVAKANGFGDYDKGQCFDLSIHNPSVTLGQIRGGDLVCLTSTVSNYENCIRFAKLLKRKRTKVAIGGPWASVKSKQIQENQDCFDYVIRGEGESALLKLLNGKLEPGIHRSPVNICTIPSLDFSGWTHTDLETFQTNYQAMLETGRYGEVSEEIPYFVFYQSARGCVQKPKCGFCGSRLGSKYNARTSDQFFADIESILSQIQPFNPDIHIFDCSDSFGSGIERLDLEEITRFPGVSFTVYSRADEVTEESAKKLAKLGVTKVSIGIETGSKRMMAQIGKGIDVEKHFEAVRILADQGIKVYANILYGSPGENLDDIKTTVDHFADLTKLGKFYRVAGRITTPLPNSKWYFQLLKRIKETRPQLKEGIHQSDKANSTLLQDLWLKKMTDLTLEEITRAHHQLISIAEEQGISYSSKDPRGIQ